jgi:hypothetical protein
MIKDILGFISWQWAKFEFWQKAFIVSSFFFGAALVAEPPYVAYLSAVPMAVVFGFMTKWLIWDGTKSAWEKYKKDKAGLFDTIKSSEK